jgi:hypothetical protein
MYFDGLCIKTSTIVELSFKEVNIFSLIL